MAIIKISGMSCQHCVASTKKALEKISGIENVEIDLVKGEANYSGEVDVEVINKAITEIGFEVT